MSTRSKRQTAVPDDFGVFYIETRLRTFRSVRRLAGDADLAHDAAQEAYARIFRFGRRADAAVRKPITYTRLRLRATSSSTGFDVTGGL